MPRDLRGAQGRLNRQAHLPGQSLKAPIRRTRSPLADPASEGVDGRLILVRHRVVSGQEERRVGVHGGHRLQPGYTVVDGVVGQFGGADQSMKEDALGAGLAG